MLPDTHPQTASFALYRKSLRRLFLFVSSALILPEMIVLSVGLLFPRHRVMYVSPQAGKAAGHKEKAS